MWNIPSIFSLAEAAGVSWAAFPDADGYPTKYYTSLTTAPGTGTSTRRRSSSRWPRPAPFPDLLRVEPGRLRRAPARDEQPGIRDQGPDLVWQRVQAVIDGGGWPDTTFILTWDDWGGYADRFLPRDRDRSRRVAPERFPGDRRLADPADHVRQQGRPGHRSRWHSHASIPKTIIDLLGLPPIGVPRVDTAVHWPTASTRRRIGRPRRLMARRSPSPPLRTRPQCRHIPGPWPGPTGQPLPDLVTLDGSTIPAPADAVVHAKPPRPPALPVPVPAPPPGPAPSPALGDLVDKPYSGATATELAAAPLTALKGISPTKAAALTQALGARTIGELATNRYVQAAQTINEAST